MYFNSSVDNTGLVYNCQFFSGLCVGVRGDVSLYENNMTALQTEQQLILGTTVTDEFSFVSAITEGRLFDQGREY